jgi:hypothetical protein
VAEKDKQCHEGKEKQCVFREGILGRREEPLPEAVSGMRAKLPREASEEVRVRAKIKAHGRQTKAPSAGLIPREIPSPVATPFPPFPRSQKEKMWPKKTESPARAGAHSDP